MATNAFIEETHAFTAKNFLFLYSNKGLERCRHKKTGKVSGFIFMLFQAVL